MIPADEYGGGTVGVWDIGIYRNISEKDAQVLHTAQVLQNGHVDFALGGHKLSGAFALTKMGKWKGWLFIKKDDEHASRDGEPVDARPKSAVSGRDLDEMRRELG